MKNKIVLGLLLIWTNSIHADFLIDMEKNDSHTLHKAVYRECWYYILKPVGVPDWCDEPSLDPQWVGTSCEDEIDFKEHYMSCEDELLCCRMSWKSLGRGGRMALWGFAIGPWVALELGGRSANANELELEIGGLGEIEAMGENGGIENGWEAMGENGGIENGLEIGLLGIWGEIEGRMEEIEYEKINWRMWTYGNYWSKSLHLMY